MALAEPWYPHQLQWPGYRAPGFSSTCWGCRGKRSADPEPEPYYGYYGYRFGPGLAYHGYGATSFEYRSPQGLRGKRSADAEPEADALLYGYPGFYGYPGLYRPYLYGPGVAGHPGGATSYTQRSPQGLGKRSAPEEPKNAYGVHPSGGKSFVGNTVWGFPQ